MSTSDIDILHPNIENDGMMAVSGAEGVQPVTPSALMNLMQRQPNMQHLQMQPATNFTAQNMVAEPLQEEEDNQRKSQFASSSK